MYPSEAPFALTCILKTDPVFAADTASHLSSNCGLQIHR
jgi:hypothetical protein